MNPSLSVPNGSCLQPRMRTAQLSPISPQSQERGYSQ